MVTSSQTLRLRFAHNQEEITPLFDCLKASTLDAGTFVNLLTIFITLCSSSVHLHEQDCAFFEPNCSIEAFHTAIRANFSAIFDFAQRQLLDTSETQDPRLRNLAEIFITDCCGGSGSSSSGGGNTE